MASSNMWAADEEFEPSEDATTDAVEDALDDAPERPEGPSLDVGRLSNLEHRPALDTLKRDLTALLEDGLDGFDVVDEPRRDLVLWMGRVAVRTWGRLPDDWFRWVGLTPPIAVMFFDDAAYRASVLDVAEVSDSAARGWRTLIVDEFVEPAGASALAALAQKATQYDATSETPDPERQNAPGMRPGLKDLERQQRDVLASWLDGFSDERGLRLWVQEAREATEQLLPEHFTLRVTRSPLHRSAALDDGTFHLRAQLACDELLPLYNQAARRVAASANEYIDESGVHHSPTKGY